MLDNDLPPTAEVVIIGAGVMGLSTAYHLAKAGCGSVVVLEKAELPGSGATGANAGGIRHQFSSVINVELSRLSIEMMVNFESLTGHPLDLNLCGYLFLFDSKSSFEQARSDVRLQNELGVGTQLLSPDQVQAHVPLVDLEGIVGGTFYEGDGLADPSMVVNGYAGAAQTLGVKLAYCQRSTAIQIEGGRVRGVETPSGTIATPNVVIAAGPWSGEVGRLANVELPVVPLRRQIAVTLPIDEIDRSFPFVIDFSRSLYFHYEGGGILTGMSNPDETPGFHPGLDDDWRTVHFEQAVKRLPLLADARVHSEWAGFYEVTPDHQPILGRLPQVAGLFSCAGFSGHGFMHGPIAGLLLAEEILEGEATTVNIDPLRWRAFDAGATEGEERVV